MHIIVEFIRRSWMRSTIFLFIHCGAQQIIYSSFLTTDSRNIAFANKLDNIIAMRWSNKHIIIFSVLSLRIIMNFNRSNKSFLLLCDFVGIYGSFHIIFSLLPFAFFLLYEKYLVYVWPIVNANSQCFVSWFLMRFGRKFNEFEHKTKNAASKILW